MSDLTQTEAFKAIQASFQVWQDAWNRGDLEAFLDSYWQSDSVRYVSGQTMVYGFDVIAELYRSRYTDDDAPGMGQMKLEISPDFILKDEALIFGRYQALNYEGQIMGHGVFTAHLRRIEGDWKIVSDHASSIE